MNIDEIRAEIPKAFGRFCTVSKVWLENNDVDTRDFELEDYPKTAVRILIDRAYEAGKATGYQNGWDFGYTEGVEASENYKRGFEAGKAEGQKSGVLFDAAKKVGYDEAAKEPKAWYVLDKNGEQVFIEDTVKYLDEVLTVFAINGDWIVPDESSRTIQADMCEKVIPDSWESLRDDIVEQLYASVPMKNDQPYKEKANEFIDRAKKLAEVD